MRTLNLNSKRLKESKLKLDIDKNKLYYLIHLKREQV